ncbi:hypothetical protein TW95_gp1569 [Pandoravirus inopinatum]|uniref:Uncharacterized protein n=1 Tax=Pandoravirus inopinatum TaxID=1605721 RepID=A0A0B5IZH7_9VIRU|nr:hypothetical protein TW95_gp1569 [Pandoravirus inopinatum]AJF98303.1 hypothetical protein [Pandoravirus inopinatum]
MSSCIAAKIIAWRTPPRPVGSSRRPTAQLDTFWLGGQQPARRPPMGHAALPLTDSHSASTPRWPSNEAIWAITRCCPLTRRTACRKRQPGLSLGAFFMGQRNVARPLGLCQGGHRLRQA